MKIKIKPSLAADERAERRAARRAREHLTKTTTRSPTWQVNNNNKPIIIIMQWRLHDSGNQG